MSKAPETIYIDRDGPIGRWYTQLEKDVDVAYVRGDIAYGYASEVERLRARIATLESALKLYADPKKWTEFRVTCGDIFGAQDGDQAMAFDSPDDCPWSVAAEALNR